MGTKKVIAGLAAAACVVVVVVVPCVLLIPGEDETAPDDRPAYTFDDLYSSRFSYDYLYPNWDESTPSSTDHILMNSNRDIVRQDITNPDDEGEVLFDGQVYKDLKANGYSVSKTGDYVWMRYNYKKVWRHSYMADFNVYRIEDGAELSSTVTGFPKDGGIHYVEWSPVGNKLAIVYGWNMWYIDLDAATPTLVQITTDGAENKIYNGIPDWVYEEESISGNKVLYWSPEATRIAFLRTDDTNTNIVEYSMYDDPQYPRTVKIAYPKAGSPIGKPSLHVYDIAADELWELESAYTADKDHYFHRFVWMSEDICLPTWSNRVQDESIAKWCIYNPTDKFDCSLTGKANKENVANGWVGSFNPFDVKVHDNAGGYFTIYARSNDGDSSDGYWQLVYIDAATNDDNYNFMTKTPYDIVELMHYDNVSDFIYFLAVYPNARDRQIMRLQSSARDVTEPECMTCGLGNIYPDRCGWVAGSFNKENDAVVINCRGPMQPLTLYIEIQNGDWKNSASEIIVIKSNDQLIKDVATVKWPVREYNSFKSDRSGYSYNYEIWRPADFDPSKKYPLLIEVYAGPEFQKVQSTWTNNFAQTYMVSSRDIIVASVDGRGSAYQGYKFMQEVYKKLGQYEPVDQTDFAIHLLDTHSYLDKDNVAIWGWSYGGYTTSHTLGYDNGNGDTVFKCGVAVAPLADWRFYDAMYAERYMRMPEDNEDGYNKASIITGHDLENFKNTWYTLIHGTADDNVHFQNAAEMEKALVEADVDFDDFFYADQAHSINIGNANRHVYRQIDTRLSTCLGKVTSHYPENLLNPKFIRHH